MGEPAAAVHEVDDPRRVLAGLDLAAGDGLRPPPRPVGPVPARHPPRRPGGPGQPALPPPDQVALVPGSVRGQRPGPPRRRPVRLLRARRRRQPHGAFGIRAAITGHDSDVQVVGDPYDVEAVLSVAERTHAEFVWDEVLPSRFNHPTRNALVLAAQRTHVADLHAHVMESEELRASGRWRYECIPGVKDRGSAHASPDDQRQPGEVYWPRAVRRDSAHERCAKTAHARAAQIQQDPTQRGAGIFRNARVGVRRRRPRRACALVRYWDKAATGRGRRRRSGLHGGRARRSRQGRPVLAGRHAARAGGARIRSSSGSAWSRGRSTRAAPRSGSRRSPAAAART